MIGDCSAFDAEQIMESSFFARTDTFGLRDDEIALAENQVDFSDHHAQAELRQYRHRRDIARQPVSHTWVCWMYFSVRM